MPSPFPASRSIAQWRAARRLYPIYSALAIHFGLDTPPFEELDSVDQASEPEVLARLESWLDVMDSRLQVHQFRQLLHGTGISVSEEKLHALIERHYRKAEKSEADRDKLDFLLVQYFAVCAPPSLQDRELRLEDAAEVLSPVLGPVALEIPEWLRPVENWIVTLRQFTKLRDLQECRLALQGRQLKAAARHLYFAPLSLVAFTRFSYLLRRTFFHLINVELKAIEGGLTRLADAGVETLDCTAAQMPGVVTLGELRRFCEGYKKPAVPEYSVDTSIERLLALRQIIDAAQAQVQSPDNPAMSEIEARCQRIEDELTEVRRLAAGLIAQMRQLAAERELLEAKPVPVAALPTPPAPPPPLAAAVAPPPPPMTITTVEPPPPPQPVVEVALPAPPTAPPSGPAVPVPNITDVMEDIRRRLAAAPRKGISSLNIAGAALLLSAEEVDAFLRPKDTTSIDLQRSLAARALLLHVLELQKRTGSPDLLAHTLQSCRTEAANIQQHSAEAKQANQVQTATVLNASASQLLSLLKQVERSLRAS